MKKHFLTEIWLTFINKFLENQEKKSSMFMVFIMGTAGSGKSYLTSEFDKWLKLSDQKE